MATLQYDFRVVGMNSVMAAFRSLEQRALQHNRVIARTFGGTGGGAGGAGGAARAGGARGGQADAHVRERQRMLRQQAADDRRSFQESARSHRQFLAFRDRMYREERQQQDRHAREQIRTARRMERERIVAKKQADREAYRTAYRKATSRYEAGVGALTSLGSRAAGLLAVGGGAAIAAGVSSELKIGKSAALLAGMARQGGDTRNLKEMQAGIVQQARTVGTATGMSREDIIGGMSGFFAKAGELDVGKEMAPFFADMAQITNSSMEDIGEMAGMAYFQAITKGMSKKQARAATEEIVRSFAAQAAAGTIEMKDYVKVGSKLLSAAGLYQGNLAKNAAAISAIAQTTPGGGVTSAAEAATSLARLGDTFREKHDVFKKLGVETYTRSATGQTVLRDPLEVIKDMLKVTGGNLDKLEQFDFNIRSERAVMGLHQKFAEAGGGEEGIRAVETYLDRFLKARVDPQMQAELAANYRAQPAVQFEAAFNQLKDEIGKSLLPALTQLAPAMSKLVVALKPLIDWLGRFAQSAVENPWGTIIEGVTLALVGSVAKAAIGEAIKAQIVKMLIVSGGVPLPGTPGVPGVPPVVTGGGGGSLLTGFAGRAAGLLAISTLAGDQASKTAEEIQDTQNLAEDAALKQFREKGTIRMSYQRAASEYLPFIKENVTKDLTSTELLGLSSQGVIQPKDFINQFGREGAQRLGLITEGGELAAPGGLEKAVADKQQAAADTFKTAVAAFAEAATQIGGAAGGGLFNTLFGGLNRGSAPSPANASSAGGSR